MFTIVLHLRNTCTIQAPVYYEQFSWFQSPHGPGSVFIIPTTLCVMEILGSVTLVTAKEC